jgi:phospholipid transport system substrate-binding protein
VGGARVPGEPSITRALITDASAAVARAETATEALKARDVEIRAVLPKQGSEPTPAQRKQLESILTKAVDLEGMAKSALGTTWTQTPPAKRKKFLDAFVARFRKATSEQLDQYRSTAVKYLPETKADDDTMVPTEVAVKGEPTRIEYRMRQEAGHWRIVDIVVDDVSTVENYRASFNRIIKKEGMDGLISRLSGDAKKSDISGAPEKSAASEGGKGSSR